MRVVPTMIVRFMKETGALQLSGTLPADFAGVLSALVGLAEELPPELMPADVQKQLALTAGLASIKAALGKFHAGSSEIRIYGMRGFGSRTPLEMVFEALIGLPDSVPATETKGLEFIEDGALRDSIRLDLSDAASALRNKEWKAATVLAGSVIEALLLWELTKHDLNDLRAISPKPLNEWPLHHYLEGARKLGCLSKDTIDVAGHAKDFRNLIHPGRAQRVQATCDLGTAHVAVGAADHVARDLAGALCPRHRQNIGSS